MGDHIWFHEPSCQNLRISDSNTTTYKHVTELGNFPDVYYIARIQKSKEPDVQLGRYGSAVEPRSRSPSTSTALRTRWCPSKAALLG